MLSPSMNTRRKLNAHKTFQRRSGRLTNVLSMFILRRPLSEGRNVIYMKGEISNVSNTKTEIVFVDQKPCSQ